MADASDACTRTVARFPVHEAAVVSNADAAFVGTVVETRRVTSPAGPVVLVGPSVLTFSVDELVKGRLEDRVEIVTAGSAMCGIDGSVGMRMGLLLTRREDAWGPWGAEAVPISVFRRAAAWVERAKRPYVMQLGRGLGPFRVGRRRTIFTGLIKEIRHEENDAPGCSGGFPQDSFVDVYRRIRLGYASTFEGTTYLDTVATIRPGDGTSLGFVIGSSTLAEVRKRYRSLRVSRHVGGSTLLVRHRTGYESSAYLEYAFDAAGKLVRLETGVGGC
jgi:hypothetical protein